MCGIHVLIQPVSDGLAAIQKMMHATEHRGPDFSGFCKVEDDIFFAANRLKIQDLSDASNQPLWCEDQSALLVFNGELYNHPELKEILVNRGHHLDTGSDSVVLLHWLKTFGKKGIQQLKGMFAFVFADLGKKEILVSRDASGEKPLYFHQHGNSWIFSSETKGILAGMKNKPKIDKTQFLPFFYYRHSMPDRSFFEEVRQVLPGEIIILDFDGHVIQREKMVLEPNQKHETSQNKFEEILKEAVSKSFAAQRPVGMVLSGGADSSLLYAVGYELTGQKFPTYTVALESKLQHKYRDPHFVRIFNQQYPSENREIRVNKSTLMDNWGAYIQSMDQPIGDSAGFLTWLVAKEAKEEVKVLISGAGADELFAGYNRHRAFRHYLNHPTLLRQIATFSDFPFPGYLKKLLQSISKNPEDTFIQMAAVEKIPEAYLGFFRPWYPKSEFGFKNALDWDRTFYLVNDILKIHDNACMAHGIEGRAPYLYSELLEFALFQTEEELLKSKGKVFIKEALRKRGLGQIADRKKLGFGLPLQEWMEENDFREWIFEPIRQLSKDWGECFPPEMLKFTAQPEKAEKRHFLLVWNMFILAGWLSKFSK
ncbi:asparagine synthase (glutamine-hydrolyzing) [Aquiflexum sp. LQ15W]|uniref:asparagine synthase (glutamine-hydrolyzing) n=1 Tax=Cognataquiflexum nitidum TaxID=2922272 RepID=UPI001F139B21|nr:asparagine synthase (glutamine-hydrolyzing) [Cognataquiflexum nitidum]MCH6199805.1 asparagine synthase (glutamine-hydrolyzing) [Cognataquiflexum nitidum]